MVTSEGIDQSMSALMVTVCGASELFAQLDLADQDRRLGSLGVTPVGLAADAGRSCLA